MGSSASSNDSSSSESEEDSESAFTTGGDDVDSAVHHVAPQEKGQNEELDVKNFHLVDLFNSQSLREAVSKVSDIIPETVVQQHHGHLLRWLEERNMRNEETVTVSQFCDVLFNRGVNRKEAEEAFEQFDVDGEGVAYIDSMTEALKSTNGANLRGELSHAIRTLRACSLAPGVIDIFCPQTSELGNHGQRILKYLLRNRAPSNTLPYPALDGFTNITAMRMVVLEQYLKNAQNRKENTAGDDCLNELKFLNKPYCSLMVSSNRQDASRLTDNDSSTFWQSDGPAHSHWIRLKVKSGVSLSSLSIVVTRSDQSYMPQHIVVTGGNSPGTMEMVKEIHIQSSHPSDEVVLLTNAKVKSRFVQINIKRCQYEGCDVRVHGLKAVGARAVTGMEVNVTETSAVWYLSILTATATAAIPMAPLLQGVILQNTKAALEQMPPLSLCKLYCKKNSFVTPKILDQVEEFLQTVARNPDSKVSLEGLLLLLQLSLARGNIPTIIKCLMDIHEFFSFFKGASSRSDWLGCDHPVLGGDKIMRNVEHVHGSLLRKHATVLESFEVESDGGMKDAKSPASNVLTSNWNSEAYISNKPNVTMVFHNPNHSFQLTKIDMKVCKGGIGPKCGVVLVADELFTFAEQLKHLEEHKETQKWTEINCDLGFLDSYNDWTEEDCRKFREEGPRSSCPNCSGEPPPSGPLGTCPACPTKDTPRISEEVGPGVDVRPVAAFILMDDFDEIEIPLDKIPIGSHLIIKFLRPRQESSTRLGIVGVRCHGYWKEKTLLERVEIIQPIPEEGVKFHRLLSSILWFLVTLCQNVERMSKKDSHVVGKFQSMDFNLENLCPEAICELYFKLPNNLSYYLDPREYLLQLFHCNIQQFTKAMEKGELSRAEVKEAEMKETSSNPSEPEGDAVKEAAKTQPLEEDQAVMKKMFDHLCKLLESDLPPGNLAERVHMAASRVILDGAPVFFPDKEARKKQLFNMIYDPAEDQSSRTVFQSLCWYFGSVDSSGLLDLPEDISETPVDTSAILSVFDTLLCVAYKEFEEVMEEELPDPAKECSHVVNLLNSLQVNLLTWCHKLLREGTTKAEGIVMEVLRDYCKSMFSWICNAITLWNQSGRNKQCVEALRYSFVESTFHQLLTILSWMSDARIPHLLVASHLYRVATEIHKLVAQESIRKEVQLGADLKESKDPVVLRTWQIESSHNYENNQNITQMLYCPGAQDFHIEFDSRCETERRYDYLEFTVTRGTKVRYDQKVGSDKWPEKVTFKSMNRLQFLFHSDSTTNAWGYKFTVTAKGQADVSICWVQDMQLTLSSLLGKLCSQALNQKQDVDLKDHDGDANSTLEASDVLKQVDRWSDLLVGGLRKSVKADPSSESTDEEKRVDGMDPILDFVSQLSGERPEGQQCRDLWERCVQDLSDPSQLGAGVGGDDIDRAVRVVFAAIIWHSPLLTGHIREHGNKEEMIPVTDELLSAFKIAESTRVYLVSLHQMQVKLQEAMENQSEDASSQQPEVVSKLTQHWCVRACLKKARFLLSLNPCWRSGDGVRDPGGTSSPAGTDPRAKQILEMIKSPLLSAESMRTVLLFRERHAQVKTEVYQLACQYLNIDQDIFQDSFIIFLKQMLSLREAPRVHFMQGLVGCGLACEEQYQRAFYEFVEKLVHALAPFSQRSTVSDKDNAALSCIKGFILHLLSCQWRPQDYLFLQKINLPQLLIDLAKTPDTMDMADEQNDISPEKQLEVYKKCQEWLKYCVDENNFKTWYDEVEQTTTMEERRAMHMFVARFYERLDVNIQCDGCHSAIIGTRYRCLVCEDIDFCCTCFPGGVKVERHTDDHPLVHLRFKCDGCQALIVGTRMHCNVCDDFDLCYGCHQTKNYPSRHKDHHVVTPIPMTVANQCKSQPQAYNQLHAWLLFSSFTLSMAKAANEEIVSNTECSAVTLLENCVDFILTNLRRISEYGHLSPGLGTSQEKVFMEKTLEKLLGLLAALIPGDQENEVTEMLKLDQLLPLLFKFARETTGQYVPTQHLAVGLIGKLLYRESPEFADRCLAQIEEKKDEEGGQEGEAEEDREGTKTVTFICSFGASCLEKCHLEWAALLPHLLMQLSQRPEWRAPIAKVLNDSFKQLPDNCHLPTIFALFTVAGFPEVFGHGSEAVYHDANQDHKVMVLKHFLQNGQVYVVDSRTRKTKHVTEDHLDLKGIDSQPLTSDHLVTFLSISTQIMAKIKEGSETLNVETIWALYLVLKTLHANFKPQFFEHIQPDFLPLLSFLANSQTGLSRHWLLKDLEVLSIQLYTSNRTDYNVQPLLSVGADFQTELLDSFRLLDPQTCSGLLKPHQGPLLFGDKLREATHRTSEQVHNNMEPRKTWEETMEDVNADIPGSSSASDSGSHSDDEAEESDDTFIDDQLVFVTPRESSQTRLSVFSEDSEDSFYSFEQNDVNKSTSFNMGKAITPKPVSVVYSDPLSSLDDQAKTAIEATHEAFNAPLSVLRALYELSGSDVESFIQRASSSFQGDLLNVGEDVLTLAKRWEQPTASVIQNEENVDSTPDRKDAEPELTRRVAVAEPRQNIGSLISHSKHEMRERFKKHQREKSKDLLIKELEKHGKVGTRDFLYKINHVLSILYARNLLVSLLADWPEDSHMTISENLGCQETSQLLNILDLLQRTAEEDTYKKIISVVVRHCCSDTLNQLCQSACCFMEEMALQPKTVESKHNYDNDTKIEGSVCLPGARYLLIKFDERCCTEDCCDILTIASDIKYKHNVRTFSGTSANWINFDIPGDTLYYKFVSDFNNNDWGFKFTVIGNHVGRFETGFVLLDSVLQCSLLIRSISLAKLWASLIEVCNKQVGHPRLKSIRLLLRILQHISGEDEPIGTSQAVHAESALGVDLTLLKPLWLLLNQMNTELSEDTTTCQSIHATHSALTELFFYVEGLVQSKGLVDSYILALVDEREIAASIRQGLCNVAAIGKAIGIPNKAGSLLEKDGSSPAPAQSNSSTFQK